MHDETTDDKPHVLVHDGPHPANARMELSIWFFVGMLTLVYGVVLTAEGLYERAGHQPGTVLARLQPTLWWGVVLLLFGLFYTVRVRPGKR